jgi:hypothetical protein
MFGILWDRFGSGVAFSVGAAFSLVSAIGLLFLPSPARRE